MVVYSYVSFNLEYIYFDETVTNYEATLCKHSCVMQQLYMRVYKKCPKYEIASKLDICRITNTNICFHMLNFVSRGKVKNA